VISGALSMSKSAMNQKIAQFGGTSAATVNSAVTHLIVPAGAAMTNKMMDASQKNKFIVFEEFIDACIEAGSLLDAGDPSNSSLVMGSNSTAKVNNEALLLKKAKQEAKDLGFGVGAISTPAKPSGPQQERIDIMAQTPGVTAPKVPAFKLYAGGQPNFPDYNIVGNVVLQVTNIGNNNNKYYALELHERVVNAQDNVLFRDVVGEQYEALHCDITDLQPTSQEFKDVLNRIQETMRRSKGNVYITENNIRGIYKVRREEEEQRFTTKVTENHQLLCHGSATSNFVGLLSRGILMPKLVVSMGGKRTDGGWLGDGIYFGDADTSCYYARPGSRNTRLILLNTVALGRMCPYNKITYGIKKPSAGYDSNHGVPGPGSQFQDNEYVVYDESQQKMSYLFEVA